MDLKQWDMQKEYGCDLRSNEHYLSSCENKVWKKKKKSGLYGLEFFSGLVFTSAYLVFITAKIASIFISLSAVHIYDFHSFTVHEK